MLPQALNILPDQITFESHIDSAGSLPLEAQTDAVTDFATLLYAGTGSAAAGLTKRGSDLPVDGGELPDSGIDILPEQVDVAAGFAVAPPGEQVVRGTTPWPASVPVAADAGGRRPGTVTPTSSALPPEQGQSPARQGTLSPAPDPLPDPDVEPGGNRPGNDRSPLPAQSIDLELNLRYRASDAVTAAVKAGTPAAPLAMAAPEVLEAETRPVNRRPQAAIPTTVNLADRAAAAPLDRAPGPLPALPAAEPPAGLQVVPDAAELWTTPPQQIRPLQLQPATGHGAAPAPASPLAHSAIATPVQEAAWASQLGERVVLMTNNAMQRAEIKLSPAELGPLRIQVQVDDGAANVTFHAQHAVTREAIEQALPRLREMLHESGLNLNQANIADGGERGPRHGEREAANPGEQGNELAAEGQEEIAVDAGTTAATRRARPDSLLDTFA